MEDVTVEDAGGGGWGGQGVLFVTPWLGGEAGHAWGLSHAKPPHFRTALGAMGGVGP